ncbi:MAG: hypothetical protein EAZ53_12675 [Bacteroidetes bacterium]|nr:MAG: hypothetical protein EAZ53_12675 [Bacteroidota bacterium]
MSENPTHLQVPSPQIRLDFVIKNFNLAYASTSDLNIKIDYGMRQNSALFCPDQFYKFCELSLEELADNTTWHTFNYQEIPLFFSNNVVEFYKIENQKIIFNFDIVSHIFFYLSGYQEIINQNRDKLNRFGYIHSIQKILNTAHIPIVNYLFEILKSAIEKSSDATFLHNYKPNLSFYSWITHDVDILKNIAAKNLKNAFKKLELTSIFDSLKNRNNLNLCFENITKIQNKYNFVSTYFFMTKKGNYKSFENADYAIENAEIQDIISNLQIKNNIGLHSAFGSTESKTLFENELLKLNTDLHRSHFLMFDIFKTPQILENYIKYDSSLGFYDYCGFRNGTSLPFYLFDFQSNTIMHTIEIPLIIMDATLFYEHYLNLKTEQESDMYLEPILNQMKKMGGILTINWHNHAFAEKKLTFWNNYFEKMILKLQNMNTVFYKF